MKTHKELIEDRKDLQSQMEKLQEKLNENNDQILLLAKDIIISFFNERGIELNITDYSYFHIHRFPGYFNYSLTHKKFQFSICNEYKTILFDYHKDGIYSDLFYGKDHISFNWNCHKTPFENFYKSKLKKLLES